METAKKIREEIDTKSNVSEATKNNYKSRINTLFRIEDWNKDLVKTVGLLNPKDNLSSEITIISQMLAIQRDSKTFRDLLTAEDIKNLIFLFDKMNDVRKITEKPPSRDTDVDWKYLQSFKDKLEGKKLKSSDKLIYYLYINPGIGFIPRNDFAQMKIVATEEEADSPKMNYYITDDKTIIFNEYKTSKRYGQIKIKISKELEKEIPKDQAFMFEKDGIPLSDNGISKKIQRAMKKITGREIGVVIIRRAFASHIKDLPDDDRRVIAHNMGHTSTTNTSYSHSATIEAD